ncbi:hypothetical protein LguiA_029108 [Lonicera macranthoides]
MGRSQRKLLADEELLHRQALSMAIHQHQLSQRFDGSMSRRIGSTSSRRRNNFSDSFTNGKQYKLPLVVQNFKNAVGMEKKSYKRVIRLKNELKLCNRHRQKMKARVRSKQIPKDVRGIPQEFRVARSYKTWMVINLLVRINIDHYEPFFKKLVLSILGECLYLLELSLSIMGLFVNRYKQCHYAKPLIEYLQNLREDEKDILVVHSAGGACVSYALEHFPQKISKAVFLCSTMISDGQRPFDVFAEELGSAELFVQESRFLIYGNGKEKPPTGFMFEKQQMRGLLI